MIKCKIYNPIFKNPNIKIKSMSKKDIDFWKSNGYIVEILEKQEEG